MQDEYIKRVNKVLAYMDEHLDGDLSLQVISDIACYSPFHLHRLFKAITGETLNAYVNRKRIERAAMLLMHHSELSISDIGSKYGFKSDSTFSRAFKKIYKESPSGFRKANLNKFSKISQVKSKNSQSNFITGEYICIINQLRTWISMNARIEVQEIPTRYFAYVTHVGDQHVEKAFARIVAWAHPRGVLNLEDAHVCRVFHDSFKVTDASKVRMSVGIASKQKMTGDKGIELSTVSGGKSVVGRFEITLDEFERAWDSLFIWMSEHGFKKSDRFPFELYYNNYVEHPDKKCIVDLCIPVE